MQFVWFLGRFHVLILHLALGILTLAVALEILVRFRRFRFLASALGPVWIAGAFSALATVALGLMHATEESFDDIPAVEAHGLAGMTLAAAALLTAILRTRLHPLAAWSSSVGHEKIGLRINRAMRSFFAPGAALDRAYDKLWSIPAAGGSCA
jgi:hypothetical protein